ncbi:MAG: class I mannose-6-phosphate isomerase [Oscillospiraceae bacterium]|jgi:mannose-6-phosphate isomerase|nr:class I mannose-6-phosphate isomerase [Oscillospiraceae bacterium]
MLPFLLRPAFKDYLWGGGALRRDYGKVTNLPVVAESWELSAHKDGCCVIASGAMAGTSFDVFARAHPDLLGENCRGYASFPILVKLIDAKQPLSVQVHPDDTYAYRVEGEPGKTEMWVVLDHDPGAFLYYGLRRDATKEELRSRLANGTVTELLRPCPVRRGDVFIIEAGTLHAIGAGIVLAEIQENSNSTYRVYDYGRKDVSGRERPLHIDKALDVVSLQASTPPERMPAPPVLVPCCREAATKNKNLGCGLQVQPTLEEAVGYQCRRLAATPYFITDRLDLNGSYRKNMDDNSFLCLLCAEGRAFLRSPEDSLDVRKGDCAFVPSGSAGFLLEGEGSFLLVSVPPSTRLSNAERA